MPALAVAAGLAVASAATSYMGAKAQADGQQDAADAYAKAMDIPFYGPGEKMTQKAARFLAKKYYGQPVEDMPTMEGLRTGDLAGGMADVTQGAGGVHAAPGQRVLGSAFDITGKKFNAGLGQQYGNLASTSLLAQQGANVAFKDWQNRGFSDALRMGSGATANPGAAIGSLAGGLASLIANMPEKTPQIGTDQIEYIPIERPKYDPNNPWYFNGGSSALGGGP